MAQVMKPNMSLEIGSSDKDHGNMRIKFRVYQGLGIRV